MSAGISMMQASLAQALEDLHTRIAEVVLTLDDAAVGWRPAPGIPSVEERVLAVAAEERRWIGEAIANVPRDSKFPSPLEMPDQMLKHPLFELGSVGQFSQMIVATLPAAEWVVPRQIDGQTVPVAGCVLHTLEALARALGYVELVPHLWKAHSQLPE